VNETLYRAILEAELSTEDIATRLGVDPKTVRCWLDGRVPYLRHRWALARLVGRDESDLWSQFRPIQSRPREVVAVYPHRDSVPPEHWMRVLGGARQDAGVLGDAAFLYANGLELVSRLAVLASAGTRVRICLADGGMGGPAHPLPGHPVPPPDAAIRAAAGRAEVREYEARAYYTMCYADDDFMIAQHAFGVVDGQVPVLRLRRTTEGEMATSYLRSFDQIWTSAT
jgi:hypothetical protein